MDGMTVLTTEKVEKLMEKRQKESDEVKRFIKLNPYPSYEEMNDVIETMKELGYPEKPLIQCYHRDLLMKTYNELYDEGKVIEYGAELTNITFTGTYKNLEDMKFFFRRTNFLILQAIIKFNYDKHTRRNKHIDKETVLGWSRKIEQWWNDIGENFGIYADFSKWKPDKVRFTPDRRKP